MRVVCKCLASRYGLSIAILVIEMSLLLPNLRAQESGLSVADELKGRIARHSRILADQFNETRADLRGLQHVDRAYFASRSIRMGAQFDRSVAEDFASIATEAISASIKDSETLSQIEVFRLSSAIDDLMHFDSRLGIRVVANLLKTVEDRQATLGDGGGTLSDLLATIALKTTDRDTALTENLIFASLKRSLSDLLPSAVAMLYRRDPDRGSRVIGRVIEQTRFNFSDSSARMLFNIDRHAFEFSEGKPFSLRDQKVILNTFVSNMIDAAAMEDLRPARCGMAFYAVSMRERVSKLIPERRLAFDQSVDLCTPYIGPRSRNIAFASDGIDEVATANDIFEKAKNENDKDRKLGLYRLGLSRLREKDEYARMISLLDGFEGDDFRSVSEPGWRSWRITAAYHVVIKAIREGDLSAAYNYLDKTPANLRPLVRNRLLTNSDVGLPEQFRGDCLHQLENELTRSYISPSEAADIYLDLIDLYFPVSRADSLGAFEKTIRSINKADKEPHENFSGFSWSEDVAFPDVKSDLLSHDEIAVSQALKDLSTSISRIRMRLGLLSPSLREYVKLRASANIVRRD